MKISKGQIVAITTGEYSDYCLRDHMRALQDFETGEEMTRFKCETDGKYPSEQAGFLAWTIREGILEPIESSEVVEFHIGNYGGLSDFRN